MGYPFDSGQVQGRWADQATGEAGKLANDANLESHLLDPGVTEAVAEAQAERRSHSWHVRLWRRLARRS